MYNAIKSLIKMRTMFIVITIQLILGLSLLNYVEIVNEKAKEKSHTIEKLFNLENTYIGESSLYEDSKFTELNKVIDGLEKMKATNIISEYYAYYNRLILNDGQLFQALYEKKDMIDDSIQMILMDEKIALKREVTILEGRKIEKCDFEKDYTKENIPIWIEQGLKDKIKIGDTFKEAAAKDSKLNSASITFEVVGILGRDQFPRLILDKSGRISGARYTNLSIIVPLVKNHFDYGLEIVVQGTGVLAELPNAMYRDRFIEEFTKICDQNNYEPVISKLEENMAESIGNFKKEAFETKVLGIILTAFSLIGIISVVFGNINRRTREFGIKLSQGASIKTIIFELSIEIAIIFFISLVVSLIPTLVSGLESAVIIKIFLKNIIFINVLLLTILVPMLIKVKSLNIVDLVRGK